MNTWRMTARTVLDRGATATGAEGEHLAQLAFRSLPDSGILRRRSLRPACNDGGGGSAREYGGHGSEMHSSRVRRRRRGLDGMYVAGPKYLRKPPYFRSRILVPVWIQGKEKEKVQNFCSFVLFLHFWIQTPQSAKGQMLP
jgi:hypothetical protein